MPVRLLSLLAVVVLAMSQMGGCDIRFNGTNDSTGTDSNENSTGRGTTADTTIDTTGLHLAVNSSSIGEMVENGEVVIYGTVTNNSGVALAGILVKVTPKLTSGGEDSDLSVPLMGQTVSRNDETTTKAKIVSDGLYATATGVFRMTTGRTQDELEPVSRDDFTIDFSDAGVSEPASSVTFPDKSPTEGNETSTRIAEGTVENDGDRTTFHTTVVYAFKASDGAVLGFRQQVVTPTGGGTDGQLSAGATGRFKISVDTTDLGQLAAKNLFLINWTEEE